MPDITGWADLPFFCLLFVHNIVSINLVGCSLRQGGSGTDTGTGEL